MTRDNWAASGETLPLGSLTRSATNVACITTTEDGKRLDMYYLWSENKGALINCVVTLQMISAFVVAYAKSRVSQDEAHLFYFRSERFRYG